MFIWWCPECGRKNEFNMTLEFYDFDFSESETESEAQNSVRGCECFYCGQSRLSLNISAVVRFRR